jgi:hypothetical protein
MQYLILTIAFLGGAALGGIGMSIYHNPCAELVAIERARDAKEQEKEQRMKDFLTNQGRTPERPVFKDRGL